MVRVEPTDSVYFIRDEFTVIRRGELHISEKVPDKVKLLIGQYVQSGDIKVVVNMTEEEYVLAAMRND